MLRHDILCGALKPDHKLRVAHLSSRYHAAGTTVREALSRLVSEGLVTRAENKGFRVAPASLDDLSELTSTRKIIEREALRLSVQAGDSAWEAEIVGKFHLLSLVVPDRDNFLEWEVPHRAFHHALLSACGNSMLLIWQIVSTISDNAIEQSCSTSIRSAAVTSLPTIAR